MSDFDRVKEAVSLKDFAEANLEHVRGGLVCPNCKSGTGKSKTAAFSIKGDKWKCFSCEAGGDVFDLAGMIRGTTNKSEQLRLVADWAGVSLDDDSDWYMRGWDKAKGGGFKAKQDAQRAKESGAEARKEKKATDTPKNDYTAGRAKHRAYIAECAARLRDEPTEEILSYLSERGITHDEAVTLGIGYDPHPANGWQDDNGQRYNTPRLVLPWLGSDYYHIDRAIDSRAKAGKYSKPKSDEVGGQPLYNPEAFKQDYVIAVEGVLDAIAIQLCGYNAIALGGTAVNDLATEAARRNYSGVVIDMLDCDGDVHDTKNGKGRRAGSELVSLLGEAGIITLARIEYGICNDDLYGGHKDAGEWLADNRADLADMLEVMRGIAHEKEKRVKDTEYREALRKLSVKDPARVARDVLELRDIYEPVPTGITALDDVLGGGVSLGETTFFGAVSSYGKTTLAVQIADYMASRGRSVLFVTIEQSAKELVSKSLSRLVYTENATGWNIATPSEIMSLTKRRAWGEGQRATLAKAVEDYERMIAPNMNILEGSKQPTVFDVRAIAEKMKEHDGQAPIIFVDYLQLFAPISDRYDTDKRNADMNVSELRKMARDLKTHVWCISSLNRSSYSGVISLDSFKESGGIEYGADNLIGLQPEGMASKLANVAENKMKREADKLIKENKSKPERDCELTILKQRNGALPDMPLPIMFKPMAAYFMEPTRQ